MKLAVFNPYTNEVSILKDGNFQPYKAITKHTEQITNFELLFESTHKNLPVYKIN